MVSCGIDVSTDERRGPGFFTKIVLAVVALIGAAVGAMILFSSGDKEQIEALLAEGQAAVNRHDVDACIALIHPAYDHGDFDYDRICAQIRVTVTSSQVRKVEFQDPAIEVVGDLATVKVTARVTSDAMTYPQRLEFSLRRVDGRWWVDGIDAPERR